MNRIEIEQDDDSTQQEQQRHDLVLAFNATSIGSGHRKHRDDAEEVEEMESPEPAAVSSQPPPLSRPEMVGSPEVIDDSDVETEQLPTTVEDEVIGYSTSSSPTTIANIARGSGEPIRAHGASAPHHPQDSVFPAFDRSNSDGQIQRFSPSSHSLSNSPQGQGRAAMGAERPNGLTVCTSGDTSTVTSDVEELTPRGDETGKNELILTPSGRGGITSALRRNDNGIKATVTEFQHAVMAALTPWFILPIEYTPRPNIHQKWSEVEATKRQMISRTYGDMSILAASLLGCAACFVSLSGVPERSWSWWLRLCGGIALLVLTAADTLVFLRGRKQRLISAGFRLQVSFMLLLIPVLMASLTVSQRHHCHTQLTADKTASHQHACENHVPSTAFLGILGAGTIFVKVGVLPAIIATTTSFFVVVLTHHFVESPVHEAPSEAALKDTMCAIAFFISISLSWARERIVEDHARRGIVSEQAQNDAQQIRKGIDEVVAGMLPSSALTRVVTHRAVHDSTPQATLFFSRLTTFNPFETENSLGCPKESFQVLSTLFARYDSLVESHGITKICTVGDGYWAVAGLPATMNKNADTMCGFAVDASRIAETMKEESGNVDVSIGIHTGPVEAFVLGGVHQPRYVLCGETCSLTAAAQRQSQAGCIAISQATLDASQVTLELVISPAEFRQSRKYSAHNSDSSAIGSEEGKEIVLSPTIVREDGRPLPTLTSDELKGKTPSRLKKPKDLLLMFQRGSIKAETGDVSIPLYCLSTKQEQLPSFLPAGSVSAETAKPLRKIDSSGAAGRTAKFRNARDSTPSAPIPTNGWSDFNGSTSLSVTFTEDEDDSSSTSATQAFEQALGLGLGDPAASGGAEAMFFPQSLASSKTVVNKSGRRRRRRRTAAPGEGAESSPVPTTPLGLTTPRRRGVGARSAFVTAIRREQSPTSGGLAEPTKPSQHLEDELNAFVEISHRNWWVLLMQCFPTPNGKTQQEQLEHDFLSFSRAENHDVQLVARVGSFVLMFAVVCALLADEAGSGVPAASWVLCTLSCIGAAGSVAWLKVSSPTGSSFVPQLLNEFFLVYVNQAVHMIGLALIPHEISTVSNNLHFVFLGLAVCNAFTCAYIGFVIRLLLNILCLHLPQYISMDRMERATRGDDADWPVQIEVAAVSMLLALALCIHERYQRLAFAEEKFLEYFRRIEMEQRDLLHTTLKAILPPPAISAVVRWRLEDVGCCGSCSGGVEELATLLPQRTLTKHANLVVAAVEFVSPLPPLSSSTTPVGPQSAEQTPPGSIGGSDQLFAWAKYHTQATRPNRWVVRAHDSIDEKLLSYTKKGMFSCVRRFGDSLLLAGPFTNDDGELPSTAAEAPVQNNPLRVETPSTISKPISPSECASLMLHAILRVQDEVPLRAALHQGPLVSAVIGTSKLQFDVFGKAAEVPFDVLFNASERVPPVVVTSALYEDMSTGTGLQVLPPQQPISDQQLWNQLLSSCDEKQQQLLFADPTSVADGTRGRLEVRGVSLSM